MVPQAFGYLLAVVLANVCYGLGPWCERRLQVTGLERDRFRRWCFGAGVAFSVALPFLIPVIAWFNANPD